MHTSTIHRRSLENSEFEHYTEQQVAHGSMQFSEISFDAMQLIRCNYALSQREQLYVNIEHEVLEMHFRLNGTSQINGKMELDKGQHTLTVRRNHVQDVIMHPATAGEFVEIRIGKRHFDKLVEDFMPLNTGGSLPMTAQMYQLLAAIEHTPYTGKMKHLFLESKMTELLLLQVQQGREIKPFSFKSADKEKIYEAKYQLEQDFTTIADLARRISINQRKLMQGFKELFGQTIYTYVSDLRMDKAKALLLQGRYVNEVSDIIGYKNPQHFTTAFKKKYGILPGKLKL